MSEVYEYHGVVFHADLHSCRNPLCALCKTAIKESTLAALSAAREAREKEAVRRFNLWWLSEQRKDEKRHHAKGANHRYAAHTQCWECGKPIRDGRTWCLQCFELAIVRSPLGDRSVLEACRHLHAQATDSMRYLQHIQETEE